ncbi:MAG TPA: amino acid permease [Gemmatimonadales bacterium]|nr:amino acid permease [Gemmatimonadales bacterium]
MTTPGSPTTADAWGERLPRRLGLLSAWAVAVGTTIGSGIFRTPGVVAGRVDEPALFVGGWVLGGVLALAGALTYAELAAMYPRTGGMYVYIREGFGRLPAFLFGWAELLVIRPAAFGAISIVSAEYFWRLLGVNGGADLATLPISIAQATAALFIVLVGATNYCGIQFGAIIQNVSTVFKVGALALLVAMGVILPHGPVAIEALPPADGAALSAAAAFGVAMIAILWAYDGWADLAFVSGEVRDPQRILPRALMLGTGTVAVLYLAAIAVYLHIVPLASMPGSPLIAADAAQAVIGRAGVVFVSLAIMISTFGTLNGSMMTGPRVFYAMAEDRLFFRGLAAVHPRYGTPGRSIALATVLGVIFVSIREFAQLADQFIIGIWPFYALGVAAVFVLRRRDPGRPRPYRAWGYPVVPLLFLLASVYLLGNYMISETRLFLADVLVILSGVPIYLVWGRGRRREGGGDRIDA